MTKEQILALQDDSVFGKNLYKYVEFASWVNWYPDLFLDLIRPEKGGIKLDLDQRIYLRCIMRFVSLYGVFPRGWGKTFDEVLAMIIVAIRFPDVTLSLSAQTKENAAELLKDKTIEIMKFYPMLENELLGGSIKNGCRWSKNDAEVNFKSGARIDVLANAQTSKGQRRKRLNIEESALLNDALFQDALKPIPEVPRYTIGKLATVNPEELNQQINFFTTSGYRGSDEFQRSIRMINNMVKLNGEMVLGSSWFLACWYGRGSTKSQILQKKREMNPIAFAQNYESKWVGSSNGALVSISKLIACRTLQATQEKSKNEDEEFYLGVDVARSQNTSNNQSSVAVGRVIRNKDSGKIIKIEIVNIIHISNALNFQTQAQTIKKIKKRYNARAVVCDGNGVGAGLIDYLLMNTLDDNGESLGCWDTLNDDNMPETPEKAEKILYNLKAQSIQTKVVTTFIDMVEGNRLKLLVTKQLNEFSKAEEEEFEDCVAPFLETDAFIEEVANLKLKQLGNGALTVEREVKRMDKDRFSAVSYLLYYIDMFASELFEDSEYDYDFNDDDY